MAERNAVVRKPHVVCETCGYVFDMVPQHFEPIISTPQPSIEDTQEVIVRSSTPVSTLYTRLGKVLMLLTVALEFIALIFQLYYLDYPNIWPLCSFVFLYLSIANPIRMETWSRMTLLTNGLVAFLAFWAVLLS